MRVLDAGLRASRFPRLCSPLALSLAACAPQPDGDQEQHQRSGLSDVALAACQRADVQEVVGKETRGKLYKAALPRLMMMQSWLGVDSSRAIAVFDQATVTFDHVSLDDQGALGEPPYQQVVCTGHVQIDFSTATSGQEIVGIHSLRWVINISGQPSDPAKDAFTVDVDDVSIQQGLTINGRPPAAPQQSQEQADHTTPGEGIADPAAADSAADDAARAAAQANAAAAQAEAEIGSAPQPPTKQPGINNPPSEEDLYAPH